MTIGLLLFGLLNGSLLAVLVGLLGSRRNIGFGWAFILSLLLTPLGGLICVLISNPLPEGQAPRWGCLGYIFVSLIVTALALMAVALLCGLIAL